jgi:Arc/MetJ-type ribon-helix-helix transcriptional regulator
MFDGAAFVQYNHNMKTIAITIEPEMVEALDRYRAAGRKGSRSACVREALAAWFERQRRVQQEARDGEAYAKLGPKLDRQLRALVREQAKP